MPESTALFRRDERQRAVAVAALIAGAAAIASSSLFVRISETGPVATGFWRIALALPLLWAWSLVGERGNHLASFARDRRLLIAAGLFFAGDLAVWHWSIMLTSIANATLLANLAPIFVTLAAWMLFRKRPTALFLAGMGTALAGMVALIGGGVRPGGMTLFGDFLGVVTAMFYAAYQLAVTSVRARVATSSVMAWSGLFTAAALLPLALASGEQILPHTAAGWTTLVGLALIAQVAGQSLIAYAMAHLPATFLSVALLAQPVLAACYAWLLLGEALGLIQMAGGVVVLAGIRIVQRAEIGVSQKA